MFAKQAIKLYSYFSGDKISSWNIVASLLQRTPLPFCIVVSQLYHHLYWKVKMARLLPSGQFPVVYIPIYVVLATISFLLTTGKYACYGVVVVGVLVSSLLAMLWLVYARRATPLRRERRVWVLLLSSIALMSLGQLLRATGMIFPMQAAVSAYGHVLTICGYVLLWASLLTRSGKLASERMPYSLFGLDVLIILATSAYVVLLTWRHLVFAPAPAMIGGGVYCVLVVATLLVVQLMLSRVSYQHAHGPQSLLVVGILLILLADVGGSVALWLTRTHAVLCVFVGTVGWLCCGTSARWESSFYRHQAARSRIIDPLTSVTSLPLPMGMLIVALVTSLLPFHGSISTGAVRNVSIALIVLAVIRQYLAYQHYRQLYRGLQVRYAEMAKHAATDPLTGLANYRMFMDCVTIEMRRAKRYHRPVTLVFCDLDNFKLINDSYGHVIGDQVLQAMAECLQRDAREHDLVARYGGEEFVILLPETTLDQAMAFAERLREDVAQLRIPQRHGPDVTLTMSGGVSAYPESCDSLDTLLSTSDHAMYLAKRSGRNRIVPATRLRPVPHSM